MKSDMDIPKEAEEIFDKIFKEAKPVSIFVYGSRARGDFKKDSDYEVGVLFERDKKWERRELKQLHSLNNLNLYPFVYEDFIDYSLDTPFPRAVYLRELLEGAKTVRGEKVVEGMKLPAIKVSDLLEIGTFQIAYALGAVLSSRQEDWITTSIEFTKSVLFGARILVVLETKKFPLEYGEIGEQALKLDLEFQFKDLIKHALEVRKGARVDPVQLYTNITFLNQVVLQRVKD
ncbi:MAG: nucleotidyltransferase domain-containing protein, partial [Candidatus Shapirobacteria bacterium]|nr:nucleotidyltransferase domain-containing protein [Candidatus Shapirobacteria bacterium]